MKFTFEDGKINISLYELMQDLSEAQMCDLAAAVQWETPILDYFVESLMGDTAYRTFLPDLTKQRLKFLELMPVAAAEVIRALQSRVDVAEASERRWMEYVFDLDRRRPHSCNINDHSGDYRQFRKPEHPPFVSVAMKSREEVLAALPPEAQPVKPEVAEEIEF